MSYTNPPTEDVVTDDALTTAFGAIAVLLAATALESFALGVVGLLLLASAATVALVGGWL